MYIIILGTVYRGKLSLLRLIIKVIIHADAMYVSAYPHRTFPPISQYSVNVIRPELYHSDDDEEEEEEEEDDEEEEEEKNEDIDDNNNNNNNNNRGEWDHIDTGNKFNSFELRDVVAAWFDKAFFTAIIVEVDEVNEMFRLKFLDDDQEVDNYKACWMKHVQ
jgi:hypothetical protein